VMYMCRLSSCGHSSSTRECHVIWRLWTSADDNSYC